MRGLLGKLQKDGLVYCRHRLIEADSVQRLKLAMRAMRFGADPERVSNLLQWQEFEAVASVALEQNGYSVARNLRFKHAERRWEIDIVGSRKPLAICVDCKRWRHGLHLSALKRIVSEQIERIYALAQALPSLTGRTECASWKQTRLIPVVLSLTVGETRFLNDVPIVSILQLQDFLNQLPAYTDSLFSVKT
jgi:Holliday junction resolvase-like predicted endonuclease